MDASDDKANQYWSMLLELSRNHLDYFGIIWKETFLPDKPYTQEERLEWGNLTSTVQHLVKFQKRKHIFFILRRAKTKTKEKIGKV